MKSLAFLVLVFCIFGITTSCGGEKKKKKDEPTAQDLTEECKKVLADYSNCIEKADTDKAESRKCVEQLVQYIKKDYPEMEERKPTGDVIKDVAYGLVMFGALMKKCHQKKDKPVVEE